jgi:hypothetical protein
LLGNGVASSSQHIISPRFLFCDSHLQSSEWNHQFGSTSCTASHCQWLPRCVQMKCSNFRASW